MTSTADAFTTKDVRLLVEALGLVPNLLIVTLAAKRAQQRLTYPIESRDQLAKLLEGPVEEVDGRELSAKDIQRFVPDEFFPIADEPALLCRLMIAFQRGDLLHQQERAAETAAKPMTFTEETTIIPMPAPIYGNVRRT